jgi:hypothetical protein
MTQTSKPRRTEADIRRSVVAAALAYCRLTRTAMVNPSENVKMRWRQAHAGLLGAAAELEAYQSQVDQRTAASGVQR